MYINILFMKQFQKLKQYKSVIYANVNKKILIETKL